MHKIMQFPTSNTTFHCVIIPNNWHPFFTCITFNGINPPALFIIYLWKSIIYLPYKHRSALANKSVRKVNTVEVSHVGQMTCHLLQMIFISLGTNIISKWTTLLLLLTVWIFYLYNWYFIIYFYLVKEHLTHNFHLK